MWAQYLGAQPAPVAPARTDSGNWRNNPRARRLHRVIALIFTATVAANFTAMLWGPPPPWITYAPLPPLFVLMLTGLHMLAAPYLRTREKRG